MSFPTQFPVTQTYRESSYDIEDKELEGYMDGSNSSTESSKDSTDAEIQGIFAQSIGPRAKSVPVGVPPSRLGMDGLVSRMSNLTADRTTSFRSLSVLGSISPSDSPDVVYVHPLATIPQRNDQSQDESSQDTIEEESAQPMMQSPSMPEELASPLFMDETANAPWSFEVGAQFESPVSLDGRSSSIKKLAMGPTVADRSAVTLSEGDLIIPQTFYDPAAQAGSKRKRG